MKVRGQKIIPFLWFDRQAEDAVQFYVSVFEQSPTRVGESRVVSIRRYPKGPLEGPMKGMEGKVLTAEFDLAGQRFMALDGGPIFRFTEAISLYVSCDTQEEIDYLWRRLSADPSAEQCGWLKDKYGLSWQIVPGVLGALMTDPDPAKSARTMQALLGMKKLDIAALEQAHAGS